MAVLNDTRKKLDAFRELCKGRGDELGTVRYADLQELADLLETLVGELEKSVPSNMDVQRLL